MNYLGYINRFWSADDEQPFSPVETRLYFALLREFNRRRWPQSVSLSLSTLVPIIGVTAKTLAKAKDGLIHRGMIAASSAAPTAKTVYSLPLDKPAAPLQDAPAGQGCSDENQEANYGKNSISEDPNYGSNYSSNYSKNSISTPYNRKDIDIDNLSARDTRARDQEEKILPEHLDQFLEEFFNPRRKITLQQHCARMGIPLNEFRQLAEAVIIEWKLSETAHRDYKDASTHLISQIRIKHNDSKTRHNSAKLPRKPGYGLIV